MKFVKWIKSNTYDFKKAILIEKFIAMNAYTRKVKRSKINDLNFHLKKLLEKEQIKSKASKRGKKVRKRQVEKRTSGEISIFKAQAAEKRSGEKELLGR